MKVRQLAVHAKLSALFAIFSKMGARFFEFEEPCIMYLVNFTIIMLHVGWEEGEDGGGRGKKERRERER